MDSVKSYGVTEDKSKLAHTLSKILHFHSRGASSGDATKKTTAQHPKSSAVPSLEEAVFAQIFAGVSAIKAAYARLQMAQCRYHPGEIQSADEMIVLELQKLSELKHSFLKKRLPETSLETTIALCEIQELRSLILTYELTGRKLDLQLKLKGSESAFLMEKLAEVQKENELLEKHMNYTERKMSLLGFRPSHFIASYQQAVRAIRSFAKTLIRGMESAGWDIGAAADAIVSEVAFLKPSHRCYAFESLICREMFSGFSSNEESLQFEEFLEIKSMNTAEYLSRNRSSGLAEFCRKKYLRLMHPKMESSLFGNLDQWHLVKAGDHPEMPFFAAFSEMAKCIWLLHCLAFSSGTKISPFQAGKGSRFSEVWMESLNDEAFFSEVESGDPPVAFTAIPGFRVGGSVVQCQVYLQQPSELKEQR